MLPKCSQTLVFTNWVLDNSIKAIDKAAQEAIGGYQYGLGTAAFVSQDHYPVEERPSLSEADIAFAAIVSWHESSQGEYGIAFDLMMPWVPFNYVAGLDYSYEEALRNWSRVQSDVFGTKPVTEEEIMAQHKLMLAGNYGHYQASYEAALLAAELYEQDFADPTNKALGAQSQVYTEVSRLAPIGVETNFSDRP